MLKGKQNIFLFIIFLILCIGLLFIFSNNGNITEGLTNTDSQTAYDQLLSGYGDLVNKVTEQNNTLDKQINEYKKIHSSDYQKSVYENESTQKLSIIYKYLFYIYYILLLVLFVYALVKGVISFQNPVHIILLALFIGFPYIIFPIEEVIYIFFNYIWSLFTDNVYSDIYLSTEY
jgi:hypothetical protein